MIIAQVTALNRSDPISEFFAGHYPPHQPGLLAWLADTNHFVPPHGMKLKMMTDRDLANGAPWYQTGDHAAKWETSIMMGLFPDQVLMSQLPASGLPGRRLGRGPSNGSLSRAGADGGD